MTRHCVDQTFIVYCRKAAPLQQKILLKLFSTIVKKKKQAGDFSFVFKLIFYHNLIMFTAQQQIATLHLGLPSYFQVGGAMRFFKNAFKKVVHG